MKKSISKLKPTQKEISQAMLNKVKEGIKQGDKFEPVATVGNHVVNGHHRVEAHKVMGKKTVETKKASKQEIIHALKKAAKVKKGMSVSKE